MLPADAVLRLDHHWLLAAIFDADLDLVFPTAAPGVGHGLEETGKVGDPAFDRRRSDAPTWPHALVERLWRTADGGRQGYRAVVVNARPGLTEAQSLTDCGVRRDLASETWPRGAPCDVLEGVHARPAICPAQGGLTSLLKEGGRVLALRTWTSHDG